MEKFVMDKKTKMTRGSVAKKLKVNPETLRYYETQKLIKKPNRLENNYRIYDEEDMLRIKFIMMAKQLGFSLKEIKDLLSLSVTEKSDRNKVRILVSNKSNLIKEKIMQLTKMKKVLDELITLCKNNETASHCPILKTLYKK
jgi:DNA-binding transcriptional MerR regulator